MGKHFDAFGPAVLTPPWRTATGARRRLIEDERHRLASFEKRLFDAWATEDPIQSFAEALLGAFEDCHFVFFPGAVDGPPRWTLSDTLPRYRGTIQAIHAKMPVFRAYGDRARDPFANRPAGCHDLAVGFGREKMEGVVEELLEPIGFFHQLRSVLYDKKGAVVLFAGLYRTKGERPFDLNDHARLHAIQPALRRWTYLTEALGTAPMGEDELATQLERIDAPCFVVSGERVLLANRVARSLPGFGASASTWLAQGSVVPLRAKRVRLELVLLPHHLARRSVPPSRVPEKLPRYLRAVAEELARGASDKEIAATIGAPLATTRTYVARVLARLGAHSRRELMHRA